VNIIVVGHLTSSVESVDCVMLNVISTPELAGTILPGITRKSIIQLARSRGYEVLALSLEEVDYYVNWLCAE
jgi:branched-subunit amino acid aminotransferase/4-amino-4-deoxychorismate lyase